MTYADDPQLCAHSQYGWKASCTVRIREENWPWASYNLLHGLAVRTPSTGLRHPFSSHCRNWLRHPSSSHCRNWLRHPSSSHCHNWLRHTSSSHCRKWLRHTSPKTVSYLAVVLVVFSSVQFKMVSIRSEKPICAPPCLSDVSPNVAFGTVQGAEIAVSLWETTQVILWDSNAKRFKRTLIYYDTNTQYANFRGNPHRQATKRHLNGS